MILRHTAGVQAVPSHISPLNQNHFGFYGGGDIGGYQPTAAGADHDQVGIVFFTHQCEPCF